MNALKVQKNKKGGKMNKMILTVVMLAALVSLCGCNTMKGVGDDLQAVGGWVTGSAEHVEKNI